MHPSLNDFPIQGYGGKTLSLALDGLFATVTLTPSADSTGTVEIRESEADRPIFAGGLPGLSRHIARHGFYGGARLMLAACSVFGRRCRELGVELPADAGFTLAYETCIPRGAGLSGSSAIVGSTLDCLLQFYSSRAGCSSLAQLLPVHERPALALAAEAELGIAAGLQDRVVQVRPCRKIDDFGGRRTIAVSRRTHSIERAPAGVRGAGLDGLFASPHGAARPRRV